MELISRNIKVKTSKIYSLLLKTSYGNIFIHAKHHYNIQNKLCSMFPSEYSAMLMKKSNVTTLKTSGKEILIKDIPTAWISEEFSMREKIELHSFNWISLLDVDMDLQCLKTVRNHIKFWIRNLKKSPIAYKSISERVYNWVTHYNLISKTCDNDFIKKFTYSLLYQMRCLQKIMYLKTSPIEKIELIRAIVIAYASIDKIYIVKKALKELDDYIKITDCINDTKSTYDLVKMLRCLIEINSMGYICKQKISPETISLTSKLAGIVQNIRQADGGICLFQSTFTPDPTYIDSLLSYTAVQTNKKNDSGYLHIKSIDAEFFVNLRNKQLSHEFSYKKQRMILGDFFDFAGNVTCSHWSDVEAFIKEESGNMQFNGKSSFIANDHKIVFSKKLTLNSFGTELRNEENFSTQSFDVVKYFMLPGEAKITLLEYQNGLFLAFPSGVKWIWNFSDNAKIAYDTNHNYMINGESFPITLLTVSVNTNESDNLTWSLKKNIS